MDGFLILEGKELAWLKDQILNLQQQNLLLIIQV